MPCGRTDGLRHHAKADECNRADGIANRPAGRAFAARVGPAGRYRSYSKDSVKAVSPGSDQLRLTNEKSVLPPQPATDGNATP